MILIRLLEIPHKKVRNIHPIQHSVGRKLSTYHPGKSGQEINRCCDLITITPYRGRIKLVRCCGLITMQKDIAAGSIVVARPTDGRVVPLTSSGRVNDGVSQISSTKGRIDRYTNSIATGSVG